MTTRLRGTQIPFFIDSYAKSEDNDLPLTKMILAHRRAGKSQGISLQARQEFMELYNHKQIYTVKADIDTYNPTMYFFAPTKLQARDIIWGYVKRFIATIPGIRLHNQTLSAILPRPHLGDEITFKLMASKYHDSARGSKLWRAWVDELQDAPPSAITTSIGPALKDLNGKMTTTATVKGRHDHLYKMYCMLLELGAPVYVFPVTRTGIFSHEEIIRFKKESFDGSFEREYMLDFYAPVEGALFAQRLLDLERTVQDFYSSEYEESASVCVGVDIGVGKGFAAWVAQVEGEREWARINILDYYEDYEAIDHFKNDLLDDGYDPDIIFIPHDGGNRIFTREKRTTNRDVIRETFPRARIRPIEKPENQMAAIDNVNRHLHLLKFQSDERGGHDCHMGLRKLKEYSKKKNAQTGQFEDKVDKSKGVDHAGDALRTLIGGFKCRDGKIRAIPTFKIDQRIEIPERHSIIREQVGCSFNRQGGMYGNEKKPPWSRFRHISTA